MNRTQRSSSPKDSLCQLQKLRHVQENPLLAALVILTVFQLHSCLCHVASATSACPQLRLVPGKPAQGTGDTRVCRQKVDSRNDKGAILHETGKWRNMLAYLDLALTTFVQVKMVGAVCSDRECVFQANR